MIRAALIRLDRALRLSPLESALAISALAVAVYAVGAPFVVSRYPPMTDLPFHAAETGSLFHYFDPSYHAREQFEIRPIAVPYFSQYALGALFMLVLPTIAAVKLAAAVMIGLVPAGLAVMFHGMKKSPLLGLLGLATCWCNLSHWGFLNFVGALGLFAMSIGFTMLIVDRPTRGRAIGLALTLVALFFTHIFRFPFGLAAVVGTAIVMYPATRRFRPILLPMVPALALLAAWFVARPKELVADVGPIHVHDERMHEYAGLLTGAFTDPAERIAFDAFYRTVLFVAVICVVAAIASSIVRTRSSSALWNACATFVPLACAGVFLVGFLVLPMQIGAWWYVYPREATAATFILLGAFPDLPRAIWLRAPLVAALAVAGLGVARVVVDNYRRFDALTRDFAAIIQEIPKAPKLMYLIFDHTGSTRSNTPFIHLPAYVQAEKGGWLSFHFAVWGTAPIGYRPRDEPGAVVPPPVPLRWEWTPQSFEVRRYGAFFDWFLVRTPRSPDGLFAADPSIERVDHVGTWWLYRRRKQ